MLAILAMGFVPATALAEAPRPSGERPWLEEPVRAPSNAFEITVGTGYTQGLGMVRPGLSLPNVANAGAGFDLGLGYRIDPRWQVSLNGQYQELNPTRGDSVRGFTTTIAVQYHFAPTNRLDPWLELGGGYRGLLENPAVGPKLFVHGPQLGRARVGLDIRAGEHIAVGPMVGADANVFFFQSVDGENTAFSNPRVGTFVFGGVQGRFDIGF